MPNKPEYTIAVCNYNMCNTLRESLESIKKSVDDRFEILVIDDGSTDGSQEILEKLGQKYSSFRWIEADNSNLGEARQMAVEEARGKYILSQLDTDDAYNDVIQDLVEIYHQIEDQVEFDLYMRTHGAKIAKKSLLQDYPYRSLGYGEDKDLWRRLYADEKIMFLDHEPYSRSLGYDREGAELFKMRYRSAVTMFRGGVSLLSYLKYKIRDLRVVEDYFQFVVSPIAYLNAFYAGIYDLPEKVQDYGVLERKSRNPLSLKQIETKYDIEINRSKLSSHGKKVFCDV